MVKQNNYFALDRLFTAVRCFIDCMIEYTISSEMTRMTVMGSSLIRKATSISSRWVAACRELKSFRVDIREVKSQILKMFSFVCTWTVLDSEVPVAWFFHMSGQKTWTCISSKFFSSWTIHQSIKKVYRRLWSRRPSRLKAFFKLTEGQYRRKWAGSWYKKDSSRQCVIQCKKLKRIQQYDTIKQPI